jgi:thioredoxin 1
VVPAVPGAHSPARADRRRQSGLTIVKINADDNPVSAARYQALSLPTMKVFEGGEVVKTMIGARPRPALEAVLAAWLS